MAPDVGQARLRGDSVDSATDVPAHREASMGEKGETSSAAAALLPLPKACRLHTSSCITLQSHSPLRIHTRHSLDLLPVVRGGGARAGHKAEQLARQRVLPTDDPPVSAGRMAKCGVVAGKQSACTTGYCTPHPPATTSKSKQAGYPAQQQQRAATSEDQWGSPAGKGVAVGLQPSSFCGSVPNTSRLSSASPAGQHVTSQCATVGHNKMPLPGDRGC